MSESLSLTWTFKVLLVICSVVLRIVCNSVNEAYMDEIFHVPQAQQFCGNHWNNYDNKLTTLPGMYLIPSLLSILIQKYVSPTLLKSSLYIQFYDAVSQCSIVYLRFFNLLYIAGLIPLIQAILMDIHGSQLYVIINKKVTKQQQLFNNELKKSAKKSNRKVKNYSLNNEDKEVILENILHGYTLEILLFPVHFFYIFLFYTDVGSTFWLLFCYLCYLRIYYGKTELSNYNYIMYQIGLFICGIMAILYRQTNVIWIGFYFLLSLKDIYMKENTNFEWIKFIKYVFCNLFYLIRKLIVFVILFVGFIGFIIWNDYSIVLGDKSNHVFSIHLAQILYLVGLLILFKFLPNILDYKGFFAKITHDYIYSERYNITKLIIFLVIFFIFQHYFTYIHPFILSDNRHYSFYFNRYIINRKYIKYILTPLASFGLYFIIRETIYKNRLTLYWFISYFICCFMVLVPTPLFEFRYFILPIIIFLLNYLSPYLTLLSIIDEQIFNRLQILYKKQNNITTLPLKNLIFYIIYYINWNHYINILLYIFIDCVTVYIFIAKPFTWNDGSIARFMW